MGDLFIRTQDIIKKIEMNDVYFFTKRNTKVIAYLKNSTVELDISLYSLNEILGKNRMFFRTHKSFIVNINKIDCISKFGSNTYNIKFKDINSMAYITQKNLAILKERSIFI